MTKYIQPGIVEVDGIRAEQDDLKHLTVFWSACQRLQAMPRADEIRIMGELAAIAASNNLALRFRR